MTMKPTKSGTRIGDWFLWIECQIAKTDNCRRIPLVTLRRAITGGEILSTVVATMARELRIAADSIDDVMDGLDQEDAEAAQ